MSTGRAVSYEQAVSIISEGMLKDSQKMELPESFLNRTLPREFQGFNNSVLYKDRSEFLKYPFVQIELNPIPFDVYQLLRKAGHMPRLEQIFKKMKWKNFSTSLEMYEESKIRKEYWIYDTYSMLLSEMVSDFLGLNFENIGDAESWKLPENRSELQQKYNEFKFDDWFEELKRRLSEFLKLDGENIEDLEITEEELKVRFGYRLNLVLRLQKRQTEYNKRKRQIENAGQSELYKSLPFERQKVERDFDPILNSKEAIAKLTWNEGSPENIRMICEAAAKYKYAWWLHESYEVKAFCQLHEPVKFGSGFIGILSGQVENEFWHYDGKLSSQTLLKFRSFAQNKKTFYGHLLKYRDGRTPELPSNYNVPRFLDVPDRLRIVRNPKVTRDTIGGGSGSYNFSQMDKDGNFEVTEYDSVKRIYRKVE